MEAARSSGKLLRTYKFTTRYNPEDQIWQYTILFHKWGKSVHTLCPAPTQSHGKQRLVQTAQETQDSHSC
jgi:hypothetical protein